MRVSGNRGVLRWRTVRFPPILATWLLVLDLILETGTQHLKAMAHLPAFLQQVGSGRAARGILTQAIYIRVAVII